jgi:hypothetical protein
MFAASLLLTLTCFSQTVITQTTNKNLDSRRAAPKHFRGLYLTCWSAGMSERIDNVIGLAGNNSINAVVLDIKDASGYVAFDSRVPEVKRHGAGRVVIRDLAALVEKLHQADIYVIARMVVFVDPRLAQARPDWAVHQASKLAEGQESLSPATLWLNNRQQAWLDPAARDVWKYNVAVAKDALSRGVDEINFDYIRFPSDGDLNNMHFPNWDGGLPRHEVIADFFEFLRRQLEGSVISGDLFGLATVNRDDLGVGQIIEDAFRSFDYVCPMIYPSHFATGFLGKLNPAEHPYQVVHFSMKSARQRLLAMDPEVARRAEIRPWLQDFSLATEYDIEMVRAQIRGVAEALGEDYVGFTMWNARNRYTQDALADADR